MEPDAKDMGVSPKIEELNKILRNSKSELSKDATVHVCLGNEAADLDSMVSSLLFVILESAVRSSQDTAADVLVPVFNIPRDDFCLRKEAPFLMEQVGIEVENLTFADEISLRSLCVTDHLRLCLVDHNKLATSQSYLGGCVERIIDHHADEGAYRHVKNLNRKIKTVGSLCTLIADEMLATDPTFLEDPSIALLVVSVILLDTGNFSEKLKKGTTLDRKIYSVASKHSPIAGKKLYEKLISLRTDVSSFDTSQMMRKDAKYGTIASVDFVISSVVMSLQDWYRKDADFLHNVIGFGKKKSLDLVCVMTTYVNDSGDFCRQLLLCCPSVSDGIAQEKATFGCYALLRDVCHFVESTDLGVHKIDECSSTGLVCYQQKNVAKSRKHVMPLILQFLSKL